MENLNMAIKAIDWDLIKLQYEVLNDSKNTICVDHEIAPGLLEQAIEEHKWQRGDTTATPDFIDTVEQKANYIAAHRQLLTAPMYTKIEYLLLVKCLAVLNTVDKDDNNAPTKLKSLAVTIDTLLKHNDILAPNKTDIFEATLKHLDKLRNESDEMLDRRIKDLETKIADDIL